MSWVAVVFLVVRRRARFRWGKAGLFVLRLNSPLTEVARDRLTPRGLEHSKTATLSCGRGTSLGAVCRADLGSQRSDRAPPRRNHRVGREVVASVRHCAGNGSGGSIHSAASGGIRARQVGTRCVFGYVAVLRGIYEPAVHGSAGSGVAGAFAVPAARISGYFDGWFMEERNRYRGACSPIN